MDFVPRPYEDYYFGFDLEPKYLKLYIAYNICYWSVLNEPQRNMITLLNKLIRRLNNDGDDTWIMVYEMGCVDPNKYTIPDDAPEKFVNFVYNGKRILRNYKSNDYYQREFDSDSDCEPVHVPDYTHKKLKKVLISVLEYLEYVHPFNDEDFEKFRKVQDQDYIKKITKEIEDYKYKIKSHQESINELKSKLNF
jgi:hypothetical protein